MFVVHSYALAVVFCVLTMLCWGSWAVTRKLARPDWRFELFYWDYTLGVLLITLTLGITLGNSGTEGRAFFSDLSQASTASLISALLGGAVFNLANILLVAAIEIAGMAVAFPVGIGLALIIGIIMNYVADPVGNVVLLSAGVFFDDPRHHSGCVGVSPSGGRFDRRKQRQGLSSRRGMRRVHGNVYRFVAAAMYTDTAHPTPGKMGSYAAVFVFAVGILLSSFVWNTLAMRKPFIGAPVGFRDYFAGRLRTHFDRRVGGAIWGAGTSLNLIASEPAGFAISYGLGQGATMVAAIWGVFDLERISRGSGRHVHVASHHVR